MTTEAEELEINEQDDGTIHVTDPKDIVEEKDDDEDDNEDSTLKAEKEDQEGEQPHNSKTEENRRRRQEKKARMSERTDRLKSELAARDAMIADLTARVVQQEQKTSGTEMASLDQEIGKAREAYNYFKQAIADAHGKPNAGQVLADSTEKMVLASRRFEDLNNIKKQAIERQNQPSNIDPVIKLHGSEWIKRNNWYKPGTNDEDSEIALLIDRRMASEGWNARTPEYWDELDKRVKSRLPHRYKTLAKNNDMQYNSAQSNRARSVVTGSGRESSSSGNGNAGYTLSPERVQAIKESGNWDNVKLRNDAIRRYREYDKQNAA